MSRPGWALVALLGLAAPAAATTWHEHYAAGLERLASGDPVAAEVRFREALSRRRASGCRARTYGVHFREYLPHYYLGLSLARQGRKAEAALELSRELAAGAIDACPSTKEQAADLRSQLALLALPEAAPPATVASLPAAPVTSAPAPAPGEAASRPAATNGATTASAAPGAPSGAPVAATSVAVAAPAPSGASGPSAPARAPQQATAAAPLPRPRVQPLLGLAWSQDLGGGLGLLDGGKR